MWYSAMVRADYQDFVRKYGANISIKDLHELVWRRREDRKIDVLKSAETTFSTPQTEDERAVHELIAKHAAD